MIVLLVDRNRIYLERLKRSMETMGVKVLVADGATTALEVFRCHRISLIFADLGSAMDGGIRLLKELGKQDYKVPLYLMSEQIFLTQAEARCFGAAGFLAKTTNASAHLILDQLSSDVDEESTKE